MEVGSSTLERLPFEPSSVGGFLWHAWCRGWGWPMRKVSMIPPHTTWKLRQVSISCPWPLASQVCSQGSALLLGTQHLTDPSAKSGEEFSSQLPPQWEQSRLVSFCWWLSDAPSLLFMPAAAVTHEGGVTVYALEKRPRWKRVYPKTWSSLGIGVLFSFRLLQQSTTD